MYVQLIFNLKILFLNTTNNLPECSMAKQKILKYQHWCWVCFCVRQTSKKEIKFSTKIRVYVWLFSGYIFPFSYLYFLGPFPSHQDSLHLCSASSGMERDTASARISNWTGSTPQPRDVLVTGGKLLHSQSKEICFSKISLPLTPDFSSMMKEKKKKKKERMLASLTLKQIYLSSLIPSYTLVRNIYFLSNYSFHKDPLGMNW